MHLLLSLNPLLITQDVIQQRGFSRSEKAAENGDGDVGSGGCSGHWVRKNTEVISEIKGCEMTFS